MKKREYFMEKKPARAIALLPIGVFLVLYLGLGCLFEYGLKIKMGFYNIPIVVAFLAAILVACLQNRALPFDDKLEVMAKGVGDKNIMTMILIFLAAGVFVGVVGRSSAESVAYFMLAHIPARFAVAVLFIVSCFVSTAMGTSCGTITLIVPIAVAVAKASGFHLALCIGSVMGGAMFGDNLSFISDTTVVATQTQNCKMSDKFKVNSMIVVPAAVLVLIAYSVMGVGLQAPTHINEVEYMKVLPYLTVLVTAIAGMNVMAVLTLGTLLCGAIGIGSHLLGASGSYDLFGWFSAMGNGIIGMGELIIIAMMAGGMLEIIRENGGIDFIINKITGHVNSKRGAELSIAALVSMVNICTANNTVAILTVGNISKKIGDRFGVDNRKAASILDTFSCMVQGLIPYGVQMLLAAGLANLSPMDILPYLYYPLAIGVAALLAILLRYPKRYS